MKVLLILAFVLMLTIQTQAQYKECPALEGMNVTAEWVEYHDSGRFAWFFEQYRRYFQRRFVDGVYMMSQGSYDNDTRLVYAGWYWDEPEGIYHNGHPSCGVWIMEGY